MEGKKGKTRFLNVRISSVMELCEDDTVCGYERRLEARRGTSLVCLSINLLCV